MRLCAAYIYSDNDIFLSPVNEMGGDGCGAGATNDSGLVACQRTMANMCSSG